MKPEAAPWRRGLLWLVLLGPFFFASYGFANWLASQREGVGSIAYDWERSIPFVPWTIVPYWSIDLLYALSMFVWRRKGQVDRHALRLFCVQVVSVVFFILFPLRFSFDRPEASGLFGQLFIALGSFDKPFNQAPSLHISLLVVIWSALHQRASRALRTVIHVWMTLIAISIFTTYQHHFIDLPTGLLVGFAALWAVPIEGDSPLRHMSWTGSPVRRRLALRYLIGAVLFVALALPGGAFLWLLWPTTALLMVALNYGFIGARGFQKSEDGRLSAGTIGLMLPYTIAAWVNSRLWTLRKPAASLVADGVFIGRLPTTDDIRLSGVAAVVDFCAEVPCRAPAGVMYRSIPVLDFTVASTDALQRAAAAIEEGRARGTVLVCCALGYSRSAAAVVAWLLVTRRAADVDAALRVVRAARPFVVLHDEHSAALAALV